MANEFGQARATAPAHLFKDCELLRLHGLRSRPMMNQPCLGEPDCGLCRAVVLAVAFAATRQLDADLGHPLRVVNIDILRLPPDRNARLLPRSVCRAKRVCPSASSTKFLHIELLMRQRTMQRVHTYHEAPPTLKPHLVSAIDLPIGQLGALNGDISSQKHIAR